jgi:hypothetical protein
MRHIICSPLLFKPKKNGAHRKKVLPMRPVANKVLRSGSALPQLPLCVLPRGDAYGLRRPHTQWRRIGYVTLHMNLLYEEVKKNETAEKKLATVKLQARLCLLCQRDEESASSKSEQRLHFGCSAAFS